MSEKKGYQILSGQSRDELLAQIKQRANDGGRETALVLCMDALSNLAELRHRRLVVRSLMAFYEVYGDHEEEEDT